MISSTSPELRHIARYGQSVGTGDIRRGPVPDDFTFNSPIGLCMDRCRQVWVCDTGNNRVLVFDRDLTRILHVLDCPEAAGKGAAALGFRMPFHVCPHPDLNRVFITDMGNSRVVAMDYDERSVRFAFAFGNVARKGFEPLQDPNGVTLVRQADGSHHVFVNDEFFHTPSEPIRNRCVRFDEKGRYVSEFRSLIDPDGKRHDLYWPQGLSSDDRGNLYIANTGSYEILKCAADAPIDADYCIAADRPVISDSLGKGGGIGMMNIMRDVNVIGHRVFVPDHVSNAISVFDLDGKPVTTVAGVRPGWNHGEEPVHSLTDPIYYALEDAGLLSPYVICPGEADNLFFISEPFSSRIAKVRIDDFAAPTTSVSFVTALGGRRDEPGRTRSDDPQFNCVTSVISLQRPAKEAPADGGAPLPAYLQLNPAQQAYMAFSAAATRQYDYWFGGWSRNLWERSGAATASAAVRLNVDAGNWCFKAYREDDGGDLAPAPTRLNGYFMPGNLAMAAYHPRTPLLGQVCPGTPILLVGNFNLGIVSLYQFGPLGNLLNYGVPFGRYGTGDGCLRGPQGMAVSDDGEVFVVDALNNRIAQWQILQTGQVVFIRNFGWPADDGAKYVFTPTDVALDGAGRLFVTDQFNNRLCVFGRDGTPLWQYGREGYWEEGEDGADRLMLPTSLAIDGEHLILNDLVNRALKVFRIDGDTLEFTSGISLFKRAIDQGGVWMPFFMHAVDRQVFVADSTYNVVQVYAY